MDAGFKDEEETLMKCMSCGSTLIPIKTSLPFKVNETAIVILKELPVLQCENCVEYQIDDTVFTRVEELLASVDGATELEIIRFAA